MPVVNGIAGEYGARLQVVRLNFNDAANERVIAALAVRGHPTIVLLDREGGITRTWFGAADAEDLRPLVEALLQQRCGVCQVHGAGCLRRRA